MLREGGSRGDGEAPTHEPITLRRSSEFAHRLLPVHRHAKTAREAPASGARLLWHSYFVELCYLSFLYGLSPHITGRSLGFEIAAMPSWWWSSFGLVLGLSLAMLLVSLV
jgi:hypothetical protein